MSKPLMFVIDTYQYKIHDRDIILISEYHQNFVDKINECKRKGYVLIDEFVTQFKKPLVILELSNMFENNYTDTYSTNLNILQKMDVDKLYADLRFNILDNYQPMYEKNVNQLSCSEVLSMIDINLNVVEEYHKKTIDDCKGYYNSKDSKFIKNLINDLDNNIKLLHRFCDYLKDPKNTKLSDLDSIRDDEFMEVTNLYDGSTLSERILEIIKHSWKKITDICIMIVFLSSCTEHKTLITLLGGEHVNNLNYIIQQYCKLHPESCN